MENSQRSYVLPASILIAAVLIAGALVYSVGTSKTVDSDQDNPSVVDLAEALKDVAKGRVILGDAKAPVQIVEFADYQCPYCAKFHKEAGQKIREEYIKAGKVNMVMVDLSFLGEGSSQAALATHCAGDQGKFWGYHDRLFDVLWVVVEGGGKIDGIFSNDNLKKFAKDLGLNTVTFNSCLDSKKHADKLESGRKIAEAALGGQVSTPSLIVGGQLIQGAQPYEVFKAAIEEELNK